jgi:serine/threonine-protein kinase
MEPTTTPPLPPGPAGTPARGDVERFELLVELARDPLASAWVARDRDRKDGRLVELVRLDPYVAEVAEFRHAFLREAAALQRAAHPSLQTFRVADMAKGAVYAMREYVEAVPLRALVEGARAAGEALAPALVARIADDVLAGLRAVHHARGEGGPCVLGDLVPDSVRVAPDGRVLLACWALSIASSRAEAPRPPTRNTRLAYRAPEQLRLTAGRARRVDARTDLFSLGAILWEVLAGKPLFEADTDDDIVERIVDGPIPPLPPEGGDPARDALAAAIAQSLKREADRRFDRASSFREALAPVASLASREDVAALVTRHGGALLASRARALDAAQRGQAPAAVPPPEGPALAVIEPPPSPEVDVEIEPEPDEEPRVILNAPPSPEQEAIELARRQRTAATVKRPRVPIAAWAAGAAPPLAPARAPASDAPPTPQRPPVVAIGFAIVFVALAVLVSLVLLATR